MCGIVGIVGQSDVCARLIAGLERLEYRGYDSAGIALHDGTSVTLRRAVGKLANLKSDLEQDCPVGRVGIGHTRWATHGAASVPNAHPHQVGNVTLVHNGIIENHTELRAELAEQGVELASETDTEVAAAWLNNRLAQVDTLDEAFADLLDTLVGSYALSVIFDGYPELMFVARQGSPLAIGYGDMRDGVREMFVGSDALALAPFTDQICYLEDGDWAAIRPNEVAIFDQARRPVTRDILTIASDALKADKGRWPHYMRKEIEEQPESLGRLLITLVNHTQQDLKPILPDIDFAAADRIILLACGTAHYACHLASYWIEAIARIPVEIDLASEYRYRNRPLTGREIVIVVSQSGETADTLSALTALAGKVSARVAVVNVSTSSVAREADAVLDIQAGPEIGVASTKAFTGQLLALMGVALSAGRQRGALGTDDLAELVSELTSLPRIVADTLGRAADVEAAASELATASDIYVLGRDVNYPLALEAALKIKEISYIHAEAYAAGELKHGPIALIDQGTPVIMFDSQGDLHEKTSSNVAEVSARGAKLVRIGASQECDLLVPEAGKITTSFAYAVIAQLLAYFIAVAKGTDVDQPRNLAKSVTVE
ncbi:glucosamine--fructose-6-phosphate aminotransferase, isomerizing [Roseobacter sp. AzwK-3b]|uniref:glutamine--fructose-6-phosphate transaminase (isomerizing) n=1 Tax=Roseobacter sp. AzwK-3b TaxID=351016 RepID=UPI000156AA77|nr:glutamine--fructose-6-phosphate transaminase (isomerizing) [Roseobacter sp. AzwK-3b]EDM69929.1 glucosamine--fructose-6-phosphate aminotransferase, isomerizing [Roseobacter sp. AzwK-3b]